MLTSCLRAFLVSASLLGGIASAQTVVFNDTFGAGSTINSNPTNPAAPLIDRTAYQQVTAKTFNPNPPTLAAGHLRYGIVSTSSGFSSIEALFTQYPVTLSNVGEYIELTVVFTNQAGILTANANGTLMCALHDGSQSQPVAGGLNATSDTYATGGNAANWAGYISRILYTGGNHQICSRAAQGAVARCQDVLYNFNNPSASTIGSLTVSSLGALSVGQQYTLVFRVTKTAASAVTIASALYQGADTNGTQVFTQSVVSSSIPVSTFDALAIGYRETGSVASTMDVNSIKVVTTASTTVVPVISTQPTSQTVTVGDPVSFSVLADGGGAALSYQWKKDGNDISGATAASYSIASAAAGDAASYTVVVTDAAGSTTSNAAVLTVSTGAVAPVITAQPTAQTALVGDSATFTASFSGTAPNAAQWQKSTNGGTTYSDISGATGTTSPTSYTIPSAALSDAALYRVVVTNSVGSATSDGAALTVNEMPAITAQPVGSTITPGSSHTLSITATGSPTPTYQWKLNGVNISGATSSSYTIPNASGANAGFYTCTASNVVGSVTSSSAYVGVLSALTVSTLTPAPAGTGLNRDVLLKITFSGNVTAGSTGRIRIYDQSAPATPVETLDMSTAVPITQFSVPYRYMLKTISGQAFAYQPILINGNTATICPRSSTVLAYNKTYYVTIEPGAILDSTGATWGGISDPSAWTFTTKAAGPAAGATTLNVAADGTGDFDTVQGAVDFIPYSPANTIPRSITIQDGTYTEIVRLRSGQNLVTMQGQSRAGTTIQYLTNNNTAGQLSALGASFSSVGQRSVFGSEPNDFTLQNLTLRNSTPYTGPQAECFWGGNNAQRMTVNEVNILSYQDTIMTNGGVDFIWGSGKTFFHNCELKMVGQISGGIYVQARNTPSTTPGYFFHQCQLTRGPGVVDNGTYLARIDPNAGGGFPYSQVVWMNCRMDAHIHAAGWQLNNATTAPDVKFWEYQSVAPDGTTPIVITSRPTYNNAATGVGGSTLLNNQQMDQATRDYFANATNAIGWWPLPTIVTHPSSQSTSPTQMVTFTVAATAPIALTYQWQKDGSNIAGATSATYTINSAVAGDAGSYTCIVTDNAGSVTSNAATLTVSLAPYFTTHPATQTVTSGSVVNFTSAVLDATGVTFQWFKGASAIPGATSNAFSFTAAPADAGSYTVQATNANGTTTSNAAVLTVNYAPVITSQPVGASVFAGQSVTFSVQADALPAATYQWLKNNVAISGATSASYVISSALPSHNGSYTCAITNSVATTTSNAAVLAVTDATAPTIAAPGGGFYPLTLVADAGGQATLPSYANQAATTDNVGVTSVTQSPAAGSVRSLGVTNVTLTAFDAAGLHSSMTFAVNVVPSGSAWPALKVDLGRYSLRSDTAAPHSIEWQFDPAAPSRGYGNVGVLIRKAGAPGAQLDGNWYKAGIDAGALLAMDAVYVKDVTSGNGAVEMVFSGLPAGTHTLATFHNGFNAVTNTPSDISIAVDGVTQIASLTPTRRVMDDADAASAYLTFTATAGVDVVVSFTALGNGSSAAENTPYINGFELDGTNPAKRAKKPTPANDDEHFDGDSGSVQLAWTAGSGAVSHTVYFGTSEATMSALGNQTALTKTVNSLTSDATYYWRVDEVDASSNVTTGDTWRFRIRHLAFPGAEGYGRFARGGRGGSVIEVTNLLDYDTTKGEAVIPGSYRAAIEATGPRTIVFRVSGLIHLKRQCTIAEGNSYVTVAGQTAPGEGICLADYSAGMLGANDVIIRHMRMRLGDASQQAMDGMGQSGSDHTIIDHCSLSWTIDEATSSRGAKNITFQRNIISEALQHSYHYAAADRSKFETHAFAASISGEISSYHHNLIAHCTDRNWSLAGGLNQGGQYAGRCDIRNNVVYNWQARTTDGGVKACNFVNNYYKRGPAAGSVQYLMKPDAGSPTDRQQYYVTGNLMEQTDGSILYENDNWNAASVIIPSGATQADIQVSTPFFPDYCTTHTAREAFRIVLSDVGANAKQDAIDQRIVQETRDGTWHYKGSIATTPADPRYFNTYGTVAPNYNGIIDQPSDVLDTPSSPNAPWPGYPAYDVPADTDHDGIPDWFETAIGSDPAVASNNDDADGDGFTALEDYLNWLADPHALTATNTLATCDLAIHAGGFAAPAFAVGNAVNGSVTLAGSIATFTPGAGFNGRASFDFTITGNGVSVTRTFGICVSPTAAAFERRWIGGSSGNAFSASNWLNGSEITTAQPGNVLIFDSAGAANSTVVLTGTVNPGSVRVDGSTPFVFTGGGSLDASGTVVNNGTMRFIGGTGLSSGGTFINNGLLDIITGSQTLPANFINNGTVLDVSVVRPVSVGLAGGTFDLGIMGYAGHGYQLESSTTLTGTWTPVGGVVSGAGSTLHFQDPAASGMSKFYRVRVAP